MINIIYHLRDLALKQWPNLDSPLAKPVLCKRKPDYTALGTDPRQWKPGIKECLKPAFCIYTEKGVTPKGDGASLGGKGHV